MIILCCISSDIKRVLIVGTLRNSNDWIAYFLDYMHNNSKVQCTFLNTGSKYLKVLKSKKLFLTLKLNIKIFSNKYFMKPI